MPSGGGHAIRAEPDDRRRRLLGRRKGELNTKLRAVTDALGRPIRFAMTAGEVSDDMGAAALLRGLPGAEWLIADLRHGADRFRRVVKEKRI